MRIIGSYTRGHLLRVKLVAAYARSFALQVGYKQGITIQKQAARVCFSGDKAFHCTLPFATGGCRRPKFNHGHGIVKAIGYVQGCPVIAEGQGIRRIADILSLLAFATYKNRSSLPAMITLGCRPTGISLITSPVAGSKTCTDPGMVAPVFGSI